MTLTSPAPAGGAGPVTNDGSIHESRAGVDNKNQQPKSSENDSSQYFRSSTMKSSLRENTKTIGTKLTAFIDQLEKSKENIADEKDESRTYEGIQKIQKEEKQIKAGI